MRWRRCGARMLALMALSSRSEINLYESVSGTVAFARAAARFIESLQGVRILPDHHRSSRKQQLRLMKSRKSRNTPRGEAPDVP